MHKLFLIVKREFYTKVRNKSFIVMTFLSPLLFVAMGVLIAYLTKVNEDTVSKIAVHDVNNTLIKSLKNTKTKRFENVSALPLKIAKDSAIKNYEGLLYIPNSVNLQDLKNNVEYISEDSPSIEFILHIESAVDSILTQENLRKLDIDFAKIDSATVNSSLKLSKFSGEESLKGLNEIKIAIGGSLGYLIMMFIIIYGNFVMRSVIEEKTSRIIEIIVSSVKPFQLMMGKIIGTSLAGILQFLIWTIVGGILFYIFSAVLGFNMQPNTISPEIVEATKETQKLNTLQMYLNEISNLPLLSLFVFFIIYFIGGYFLYSSFYAAIGAAVDSETDSQQFLLPIILPLMLAIYIGFFTVINNPHGTVATIFSIIPFTSPIVMLMRIPFGVPWWQLLLSVILLFATFLLVVWVASKIYRVGILMYGKKPTWKELYKWIKY